jgi:hypothetical protein
MNRYQCIASIVISRKQSFGLQKVDSFAQGIHFAAKIGFHVLAFACKVEVGGNVLGAPHEVSFSSEHVFQALLFPHDLLRFLRIRPQIRVGGLLVYFCQLLAQFAGVKGTPEVR